MEAFLDARCETALAIGMTWDQFWHGDIEAFSFYMEEYIRKQKERVKEQDRIAWLQGSYVGEAIAACFNEDYEYPEKPRTILDEEAENEEREKLVVRGFMAFMDSHANHDGDGASIRL